MRSQLKCSFSNEDWQWLHEKWYFPGEYDVIYRRKIIVCLKNVNVFTQTQKFPTKQNLFAIRINFFRQNRTCFELNRSCSKKTVLDFGRTDLVYLKTEPVCLRKIIVFIKSGSFLLFLQTFTGLSDLKMPTVPPQFNLIPQLFDLIPDWWGLIHNEEKPGRKVYK